MWRPHAVSCDFLKRRNTTHLHRIFQLAADLVNVTLDAFSRATVHRSHEWPCNNHCIRAAMSSSTSAVAGH